MDAACPAAAAAGGQQAPSAAPPALRRSSLLDASLLESVLRCLADRDLAAAECVCVEWRRLLRSSGLWRNAEKRLHAAAESKWCSGRLGLRVKLPALPRGSAGSNHVTCVAALGCSGAAGSTLATGSADGVARVWDARTGKLLRSLKLGTAPVSAVLLHSAELCITADAHSALLWRGAQPVRRFRPHPHGPLTCMALADERLLLGSLAGTVTHADLYSGAVLQLTRHGGPITSLLPLWPSSATAAAAASHHTHCGSGSDGHGGNAGRREGVGEAALIDECVVVGNACGGVNCVSTNGGSQLWMLEASNASGGAVRALQQAQLPLFDTPRWPVLVVLHARGELHIYALPARGSRSSFSNSSTAPPSTRRVLPCVLTFELQSCRGFVRSPAGAEEPQLHRHNSPWDKDRHAALSGQTQLARGAAALRQRSRAFLIMVPPLGASCVLCVEGRTLVMLKLFGRDAPDRQHGERAGAVVVWDRQEVFESPVTAAALAAPGLLLLGFADGKAQLLRFEHGEHEHEVDMSTKRGLAER
jgi:hypothetical protein